MALSCAPRPPTIAVTSERSASNSAGSTLCEVSTTIASVTPEGAPLAGVGASVRTNTVAPPSSSREGGAR
jgi:hypothetical protein